MTERPTPAPAATYARMWSEALPLIRRNEVAPEPLPVEGGPRWGVSAVLRAERGSPVVERLVAATRAVADQAGPEHVAFDGTLIHVTIRSLEAYRADVGPDDPAIELYARTIAEEVSGEPPFEIRFAGLAPTRSGVVACGWPVDERIARLRTRLHERLRDAAPVPGPETERPRDLEHATLLLFGGTLRDPDGTAAALEARRQTAFGTARFDRVELIKTIRTEHTLRFEALRAIELTGG
jgi:2'-5' RNA ligase